jgi:hypothetical protein
MTYKNSPKQPLQEIYVVVFNYTNEHSHPVAAFTMRKKAEEYIRKLELRQQRILYDKTIWITPVYLAAGIGNIEHAIENAKKAVIREGEKLLKEKEQAATVRRARKNEKILNISGTTDKGKSKAVLEL